MNDATEERIREIFAKKKAFQLNDGQCAAVIVDCDCDWCLWNEAKKAANRESRGKQEDTHNG